MATPILGSLDGVVIKKIFGGRRHRRRIYVKKRNIVQTKSDTTTSNFARWTHFLARYESVSRKNFLTHVTIKRAQTIGSR